MCSHAHSSNRSITLICSNVNSGYALSDRASDNASDQRKTCKPELWHPEAHTSPFSMLPLQVVHYGLVDNGTAWLDLMQLIPQTKQHYLIEEETIYHAGRTLLNADNIVCSLYIVSNGKVL